MSTTVSLLSRNPAAVGGPTAGFRFLDLQERVTWLDMAAMWAAATRRAGGLAAMGVRQGDVVAMMLPTCPAFLELWFGCQILGAVPVALYPPVRLGRLDEFFARTSAMLRASSAVVLVTEPRVRRLLGQVAVAAPLRHGFVDADEVVGAPITQIAAGPDDLAMVQFSSGTTTHPKPVALTHAQILANARPITDVILSCDPLEVANGCTWLPLYHDMGLIGCVLPALLGPGVLTLISPEHFLARPALWLRAISRYRATISPAPDFAYALVTERVRDDELEGVDLSCWSLALNGAEPVSVRTCRAFTERFRRWGLRDDAIVPVYGLSEMSLAVTFADARAPLPVRRWDVEALAHGHAVPDDAGVERVDVGAPLPGYAVQIRDAKGAIVADRVIGQLWVAGPSRMSRYLDRDELPFDGPWLSTGDLGFLDAGRLTITGRAKDLIVVRGRNHAPQDLEREVDAVPGVRTGCAAAVADLDGDGERVLLFVEVREPAAGLAEACAEAVLAATSVRPDLVVLVDPGTLPRTSSGKIRRSETLVQWRAGTLTAPNAVTALHLAGAFARSALGYLRARWSNPAS